MGNALRVFAALRSFARRATVAEIAREAGLNRDQVHEALRTLDRHGVLQREVDGARRRGLYGLVAGAKLELIEPGRYERTPEHRQRVAQLVRERRAGTAPARYSPARAPSHSAAPGALRLPRHCDGPAFDACALSVFWRPKC